MMEYWLEHFYWNLEFIEYCDIYTWIYTWIYTQNYTQIYAWIYTQKYFLYSTPSTLTSTLTFICCDMLPVICTDACDLMWYVLWCSADVCDVWLSSHVEFVILYCDVILSVMFCDLSIDFYRKFYMDHRH